MTPNLNSSVTEQAVEATEDIIMPPSPQRPSDSAHQPCYNRKIAIMGYPCVGKTSLTLRFINGNFPDAYDTTIEELHHKTYKWKGRNYSLRITDTAGQQEFSLFPRSCAVDIDGFMLVYAINDRQSFEIVQTIHDKIVECVGDINVPVVLVGNKLDLQNAYRAVSREEGETLARKWNAWFVEISARDLESHHAPVRYRVNQPLPNEVNEIFERAILAIEMAKGNFNEKGIPIIGPGSREGRCSLM